MSSVVIAGNTSGSVTLDAPAIAGTTVLTLPATSGTVIVGAAGVTSVASGGTGRATNTAYAVVCGGTTTGGVEQSIASVGTSGQVLTSNGAAALPTFQTLSIPAGYAGFSIVQFASSGTWTVPTGITQAVISVLAGGGGAGGTSSASPGGQGGQGGFAQAYVTGLTPGGSVTVTVGTGGNGGNIGIGSAGTSGGTSSVTGTGVSISATGGGGGAPTGGAAGTTGAGTVTTGTALRTGSCLLSAAFSSEGNLPNTSGTGTVWTVSSLFLPGAGGRQSATGVGATAYGGMGGAVLIQY